MVSPRRDLAGQHIVVTGGNRGIGYGTVLRLAERGASVTMTCRSAELGKQAVAELEAVCPGADIRLATLDVADLASVRAFAKGLGKQQPVHALVNNAGANFWDGPSFVDGCCLTLRTNVLGPFLLTRELEPNLRAAASADRPARVVNVASVMHREPGSGEKLTQLLGAPRFWTRACSYSLAKACNVVMAHETHRRWRGQGISAFAVDPGASYTNIWSGSTGLVRSVDPLLRCLYAPPTDGGHAPAAAAAGDVAELPGSAKAAQFCARGLFATPLVTMWPLPALVASLLDWPLRFLSGGRLLHSTRAISPAAYTLDGALGAALWRQASEAVGVPE